MQEYYGNGCPVGYESRSTGWKAALSSSSGQGRKGQWCPWKQHLLVVTLLQGSSGQEDKQAQKLCLSQGSRGWSQEPSALLPISSHCQALDVSHSGKCTCACPHGHYCNTAFHHLHHYCSSVSGWFWQSQLLFLGLLMTDYSKKELHKSCVFVVEAWKQRISNSQSCLGMRELN